MTKVEIPIGWVLCNHCHKNVHTLIFREVDYTISYESGGFTKSIGFCLDCIKKAFSDFANK